MARDYEDIDDVESMTDTSLHARIREELNDHPDLDTDGIDVHVQDGRVRIAGRVGTEAELQVIEHVLTDLIGVRDVDNELMIDELVRQEQPAAADDANADVYGGGRGRGGADRTEDSAEHLLNDTAAEQYGTDDVGEAVERGHTYSPPEDPVQEGTRSGEHH